MLGKSVWAMVLGIEQAVVEDVVVDVQRGVVVAHVRVSRRLRPRCGKCARTAVFYDRGQGRRRWRSLDFGTWQVWLEADAPRVDCSTHGPTVRAFPWARHGAGHTRDFDEQVAWLATHCSKTAVTQLMRVSWRSVGNIVARVWAQTAGARDPFAGLSRIGIDEISYKRGHKYLTVVVDHDTGRLVWAAPGRDRDTLESFFDALGPQRSTLIAQVSADGADWIKTVVAQRCPDAVQCADPFHVVRWATEALDAVRRDAWNTARRAAGGSRRDGRAHGQERIVATGHAQALKRARWALWKNPENLTTRQHAKLDWIAKHDPRLHEAYLLKEGLRLVFKLHPDEAPDALDRWVQRAHDSGIESFTALARRVHNHRASILAAIEHNLSNGRIESVNTKIRLITRRAFGYRSPQALIALTMLTLGGHPPTLPGRT